jgi:uncharacterized membrane protein HdeD (DUF308 family)
MADTLWWGILLRGVILLIFGILAILYPGITLGSLAILFGVFILADGVVSLIASIAGRQLWPLFVVGLLSLAAGIISLAVPTLTLLGLLLVIAAWAIVRGLVEIAAGVAVPVAHRWLLSMAGVVSVAFGILLVIHPLVGLLAIAWLIGFYGVFYGFSLIALGLQLHSGGQALRGVMQH